MLTHLPIIIDGPNYINRILDLGINPVHVARQLSGRALMTFAEEHLARQCGVDCKSESLEFVCSPRRFGGGARRFTESEQTRLLDRLRAEIGVYVDVVTLPGTAEKGVDTTITGRLSDLPGTAEIAFLVSADRDFVPVLHKLRHRVKIALLALNDDFPVELRNEGYATLDAQREWTRLFKYSYPRFEIEQLDEKTCAELYSEADDGVHNQLRVDDNGIVYLSRAPNIGNRNLAGVQFRFETACAGNGYVGPRAASDATYITKELKTIRKAWEQGMKGCIDYPI